MTCKKRWNEVPKWLRIILYAILGSAAAIGFGLLFGMVVVWLWNWLMPMIFGLPEITFWQGVGLFILAKILFGGIGSHGGDDSSPKSSKKRHKHGGPDWRGDWKAEWNKESHKWEHYDEWWESEGREAFAKYTEQADEEPEPAPDAGPGEPKPEA